jgi:hypothetical protein
MALRVSPPRTRRLPRRPVPRFRSRRRPRPPVSRSRPQRQPRRPIPRPRPRRPRPPRPIRRPWYWWRPYWYWWGPYPRPRTRVSVYLPRQRPPGLTRVPGLERISPQVKSRFASEGCLSGCGRADWLALAMARPSHKGHAPGGGDAGEKGTLFLLSADSGEG